MAQTVWESKVTIHGIPRFRQLLMNTPECLREGKVTTKGCIEHQFVAFGGITVLFMEVKLVLGTREERVNAIAQVLAEGDACDYYNFTGGLQVSIFGILTDGTCFQFFRFARNTATRHLDESIVSAGQYNGRRIFFLPDIRAYEGPREFVHGLRPIIEIIYNILVTAYMESIEAFYQLSLRTAKKGNAITSTDHWYNSARISLEAREGAIEATEQKADSAAIDAWDLLGQSVEAARGNARLNHEWTLIGVSRRDLETGPEGRLVFRC